MGAGNKTTELISMVLEHMPQGSHLIVSRVPEGFLLQLYHDDMEVAVHFTATMPPEHYEEFIEQARPIMQTVQQEQGAS